MAFKAVCLMVVAFVLVTAKASYMNEDFKEKLYREERYLILNLVKQAVFSKSVVPASTPAPPEVKSPTPAPPVVTPSTPLYKPPTPAPPVKTPPPAPPVNPPTPVKPPTTPAPPVYKPPSPAPPVNPPTPVPPVKPPTAPAPPVYKPPSPAPTPVPPVKPPTTGPMPPPVRTRSDCTPLCGQRCKLHSRKRLCVRACMTCCDRCKCVPPGTYGNREKCGKCYTDMTTRRNKPKCP
ncbi:gibberellin-regulated protein 14 isoform X3 [Populus trichocarpa]|uniref:gibberellin-regulated protein 14 isoform X3 n=1 Tax=Populus trichocarpa TaxID=3694 RepID=UPI0022782B95|nr:gibberellin-regulated protein 14 isoform X3 [Populus trichocarpa]